MDRLDVDGEPWCYAADLTCHPTTSTAWRSCCCRFSTVNSNAAARSVASGLSCEATPVPGTGQPRQQGHPGRSLSSPDSHHQGVLQLDGH